MNIFQIRKKDLEGMSLLYQQLLPNEACVEKMESVYDRNRDNPNHTALVARHKGKVLGTLLACICEMYFGQCRSFMVIEDFVVDKDHRNSGVGTALMKHAENLARDRNCAYIMLITDSDRKESQRFYENLGYVSEAYCAFKKKI